LLDADRGHLGACPAKATPVFIFQLVCCQHFLIEE
jgi:hypothetical protein